MSWHSSHAFTHSLELVHEILLTLRYLIHRGSYSRWGISALAAQTMVLTVALYLLYGPCSYAQSPDPALQKPKETSNTPVQKPTREEEDREKEAEEARRLTELYLRNQSVFLRKGELMLELDSFYNRNRRDEFLQVGNTALETHSTRRFFNTRLIGRYGVLTDGLEIDVIAPVFVHSEIESDLGFARVKQQQDGFGDLGVAVRYQVWYERGSRPSVIVDLQGKSRTGAGLTGTGVWNVGGGVTLLKTIDPVVLFARLGYTYNFASQTRDLGNVIDYAVGMGFSLNDRVSFNVQLTGAYVGESRFIGVGTSTAGSGGSGPLTFSSRDVEIMNLIFTTTIMVTKQFFVEPLVGIGMTEQSFAIVGVRLPYRF